MNVIKDFAPTIYDIETTVKCPIGSNKANPHWPENRIVMVGIETDGNIITETPEPLANVESESNVLVVGVNLPFDIQHTYKASNLYYKTRGQQVIWDCQMAEYLLSAQTTKSPSLDEMAFRCGGTLKDDRIKKHWEAGGQTEDIDPAVLEEYLKGDLKNTRLVYENQIKEATTRKMMPLIVAHMDAVLAVTEMQYNGMKVDKYFVESKIGELALDAVKYSDEFRRLVLVFTDIPSGHIDINSPKSVSMILFGGEVKEKFRKQVGFYKNGSPKFKSEIEIKKYTGLGFNTDGIPKTAYGWSTDEKTLSKFKHHPVVQTLDKYREKSKDYSTYFSPIHSLVFPDGCIHQNLHQTITETGRLSCTQPNLQNQTDKSKSEIKKAFVSRFGEDGSIVEFDYKQLEIVALAHLSGDAQLISDINDYIDIHTALFMDLYKRKPKDDERRSFKRLSFALLYGAGLDNMAEQAGVSKSTARVFRDRFFDRYPAVKKFRASVIAELAKNRNPSGYGYDEATKLPLGSSYYRLPTGRELYYREYVQDRVDYATRITTKTTGFSYTQICNYPVQSFATGDIVPIMAGRLWRKLVNSKYADKALLINTVHDSILLDIHKDVLEEVIPYIKTILEEVPETMKSVFDINMTIKVPVSVSVGPTWYDTKERK